MTQFQPQLGNAFYKALGAEDMEPLLAINEIIANSIDSWIEEYCGNRNNTTKTIDRYQYVSKRNNYPR